MTEEELKGIEEQVRQTRATGAHSLFLPAYQCEALCAEIRRCWTVPQSDMAAKGLLQL